MNKNYLRQDLISEVMQIHKRNSCEVLKERPSGHYVACAKCNHKSVRVEKERFGDGESHHINWVAEVWTGVCQMKPCGTLNIWVELIDQETLDKENRRLLVELCDQELKRL